MNKHVRPEKPDREPTVPVPLPDMTQADVIKTLEKMANHFKAQRDDLEQRFLLAQAEVERHASARVMAETELAALKAQLNGG
jgi:hypothetical protein